MSDERDLIDSLEKNGDEYSLCRANHLKKRSSAFRRIRKRIVLPLVLKGYLLPEYPINPMDVRLFGSKFEIITFVVHGREIIWTGGRHDRPPSKVTVEYDVLENKK